jgi:Icc-related predicted phosphoesterase
MLIGAFGDSHGKRYLDQVEELPRQLQDVDLVMLAGDITDRNDPEKYAQALAEVRNSTEAPIVAVFGNDEYEQDHPEYRRRFDIIFLEDEAVNLDIDGFKLRIVGTTGSLDRPTWWQRTNVPNIWNKYRQRADTVAGLLTRDGADLLVFLSHYAPTYLTLEGEKERAFPEMGSRMLEQVLLEKRPDLIVHAHAHNGTRKATLVKLQQSLDDLGSGAGINVYNVSLPLVKGVTRFEVNRDNGTRVRLRQ